MTSTVAALHKASPPPQRPKSGAVVDLRLGEFAAVGYVSIDNAGVMEPSFYRSHETTGSLKDTAESKGRSSQRLMRPPFACNPFGGFLTGQNVNGRLGRGFMDTETYGMDALVGPQHQHKVQHEWLMDFQMHALCEKQQPESSAKLDKGIVRLPFRPRP